MTGQGHSRAIFKRADKSGNLLVADLTALGRLSFDESLALAALAARRDLVRGARFAVRWLRRLLEETTGCRSRSGTGRIRPGDPRSARARRSPGVAFLR